MYSKTDLFSQEKEISQHSSPPVISVKTTNQNGESNIQGEVIEVAHCSNELNSMVNPQDDPLSLVTRANEMCQQNHQLKLSNEIRDIEEQIKLNEEKYKSEGQQSIDLQNSMEEVYENYQNELNRRKNHKEKLDHIQNAFDYFVHQLSEITKVTTNEELKIELEKLVNDLKAKDNEKNKLNLSSTPKIQKAHETAEYLRKTRKTDVNEISALFAERSKILKDLKSVRENISLLLKKRNELNKSYNNLTREKFMILHREVVDIKTRNVIYEHELQRISERNKNTNLAIECDKNDDLIKYTLTKEKVLINLYNLMTGAIEETLKKLEDKKKLKITESELEEKSKTFENSIDLKNNTLDEIDKLIIDARPYQEELMKLSSRKEALNQDIQQEKENNAKEVEILKRNSNSKTNDMNKKMEMYTAIMQGIIKDKVKATDILNENIHKTNVLVMSHEKNLQKLFQNIIISINEEQVKLVRIAKLEKRLAAMKKEITITPQDVNDGISKNFKIQVKEKNATELMTFSSSKRKFENPHQEPPQKKVATVSNPYDYKNMRQTKTKQRVEAKIPQDDYDFDDI